MANEGDRHGDMPPVPTSLMPPARSHHRFNAAFSAAAVILTMQDIQAGIEP